MNGKSLLLICLVCIVGLIGCVDATQLILNATHSGSVMEGVPNGTFAAIRGGPGDFSSDGSLVNQFTSSDANDTWDLMRHGVVTWNTSSVPDDATIDYIFIITYTGTAKGNNWATAPNLAIVDIRPANDNDYVDGDFDSTTYTRQNTYDIAYADIGALYQATMWAITNTTYLNRTGNTSYMVVTNHVADNVAPTWASQKIFSVTFGSYSGTFPAQLVIYYTEAGAPPIAHFNMSAVIPQQYPADAMFCSFNGDGSNETTTFNTCMDNADSLGNSTVVFPANKEITLNTARFHASPARQYYGNGSTLKLINNSHTGTSAWTWLYAEPGASLSGFTLDGSRYLYQDGTNTNGIMLQGDQTFANNTVFNVNSYSVFVYGTYPSNIRITNNTIRDSKQYGIDTGGSDGPTSWGYYITVDNNTVTNNSEVGIKIRGTKNATITRNNVTLGARVGDEPSGIRLYDWDEANDNVTISYNHVTGLNENPSYCIDSDNGDNTNINIVSNTLSDCYTGIETSFNNGNISYNSIDDYSDCYNDEGSGNVWTGTVCL